MSKDKVTPKFKAPRRNKALELSRALTTICDQLISAGLGPVPFETIARHMLKLRRGAHK
jgi:hypothetical protein